VQKIIIDGYNVIYADPGLQKKLAGGGTERAREGLLARIRAYLEERNVRVTVVFDGRGGLTDAEAIIPGRLQVIYSASGQTADEVIVETLHLAANPREFIVVTSDMADIGRSARAIGAEVMPSAAFLERIKRAKPGKPDAPAAEDPEVDVDYWLEQFGKGRDDE
jgi:predicted RNA-binding protein with PIN domain